MEKHYKYIVFDDKKVAYFRKELIKTACEHIAGIIVTLLAVILIGMSHGLNCIPVLSLYTTLSQHLFSPQQITLDIAMCVLILWLLNEIGALSKSITLSKGDVLKSTISADHYFVACRDGIIIQTEDIDSEDIISAKREASRIKDKYPGESEQILQLLAELDSSKEKTATFAAISVEIIGDQLRKGNTDILRSIKDFYVP